MNFLSFIIWTADPDIFVIPILDHPVRWYGFLFAMGFILSQQVMFYVFRKDGRDEKEVETLTMYMVIAVVVGARLGHCLFYDPIHYLTNPHKILFVWEGGLASHGGAIGILTALWYFARKMKNMTYMWMLDRIVIVVCLTGAMIRTGNFMNSEILGTKTDSFTGVVFAQQVRQALMRSDNHIEDIEFRTNYEATNVPPGMEPITAVVEFKENTDSKLNLDYIKRAFSNDRYYSDHVAVANNDLNHRFYQSKGIRYSEIDFYGIARHPAQLYEAFYCLVLFFLLAHIWYWYRDKLPEGFIFALFLILLWSLRFIDEFFKVVQEPWEEGLPLNMGQILSIPLVIAGIVIMVKVLKRKTA